MMKLPFSLCLLLLSSALYAGQADHLSSLQSGLEPVALTAEQQLVRDLQTVPDYPQIPTDTVWYRMRANYQLQDVQGPHVKKYEQFFSSNERYATAMSKRAHRYIYYIYNEVEKRGMPAEIALIPIIESAFDPHAVSAGGAAGIWQFMPVTAKNFGLSRSPGYDGRRDIVSATESALNYLQKLYAMFGNWELALAAYNQGEGAVMRAIERNRRAGLPTDYQSLPLSEHARNYVPKLMAIKHIVSDPDRFGVIVEQVPNKPYFAKVRFDQPMDNKLAAKLAGIDFEEFRALNPAYEHTISLKNPDDFLLIPVDQVADFKTNLSRYDAGAAKDDIEQLAGRLGMVEPEDVLMADVAEPVIRKAKTSKKQGDKKRIKLVKRHTVKKGNTLLALAHKYDVTVEDLKRWNRGKVKVLQPGQVLIVSEPQS